MFSVDESREIVKNYPAELHISDGSNESLISNDGSNESLISNLQSA